MAMIRCFSLLPARKDKNKVNEKSSKEDFNTLLAKLQASTISSVTHDLESLNFDVAVPNGIQKNPRFNARAMSLESPVKTEVEEAYKGEDENEDLPLIEGELSDFDLQGLQTVASKEECDATDKDVKYPISDGNQANNELEDKSDRYSQKSVDTTQSGHVSDPGIDKADLWASPKFKRYCSNLENLDVNKKITHHLPPFQQDHNNKSIRPASG